jgi:hypothetical protein
VLDGRGRPAAVLAASLVWSVVGCGPRAPQRKLPEGPVAFKVALVEGDQQAKPRPLTAGSLRGQVVLVTVIDTYDARALLEVPRLKALADEHRGEPFSILCVALDPEPLAVRIFGQTFGITYLLGMVDERTAFTGPNGPLGPIDTLPTSALLDQDGVIVARMDGPWPQGTLEQAVRRLLARSRSNR